MKKAFFTLRLSCSTLIIAGLLCSCNHYYYGPNSNNIPLLKEKDDARISAALSGADETTGFELQSSYAFGKNFGGMFNFYTTGGRQNLTSANSSASEVERGNGTLTEVGLGYFKPFKDPVWIFEFYGGFGSGIVNNEYEQNESSKVGLTKLFLQPSIGYSGLSGLLDAAFSTRFSSIKFNVKEARMSSANASYHFGQIQDIRNNDRIVFIEPSIVLRVGGKNIKGVLQLTSSHALKQKDFLTQPLNTSLGILFAFNGKATK